MTGPAIPHGETRARRGRGPSTDARDERPARVGRGRLSTIDLLPDEAEGVIAWANAELRRRERPQSEILQLFNIQLSSLGLRPISKGAFSRYSVNAAVENRKLEASRAITEAILGRMAPGERSDSTLAATELIKFRLLEMIMDTGSDGEAPDPKLLGAATLALARLSQTAQREAEGRRKQAKHDLEAEKERDAQAQDERERSALETAERATKIASEAGLGPATIAAMRKGVLGLAG